jgi:hypothetical protein
MFYFDWLSIEIYFEREIGWSASVAMLLLGGSRARVTWRLNEGALFFLSIKTDQWAPIMIIRYRPACGREPRCVTFVSRALLPWSLVLVVVLMISIHPGIYFPQNAILTKRVSHISKGYSPKLYVPASESEAVPW